MGNRLVRASRSLLEAALAVAATIAVLAALSHVFVPKNNQAEFGQRDERVYGVLGQPEGSVEVLFLGDSEAYTSFSPLQLWDERGITCRFEDDRTETIAWSRVTDVQHSSSDLIFYLSKYVFFILPCDSFESPDDLEYFLKKILEPAFKNQK